MVIDASAIVAILDRQPEAAALCARLDVASPPLLVSPLSVHEAVFCLARAKAPDGLADARLVAEGQAAVAEFLRALGVKDIILSGEIGRKAIEAGKLYGEAVGHPAALSAAECFAYACAKAYRTSLLTVIAGFGLTDLC